MISKDVILRQLMLFSYIIYEKGMGLILYSLVAIDILKM